MRMSRRTTRHLICLTSLLAFVATPLLAQTGIDLLDADQVLGRGAPSSENWVLTTVRHDGEQPERVTQAQTREYEYDDGMFENYENVHVLAGALTEFAKEYAQRFVLNSAGRVVSVEVCFQRPENVATRDLRFDLVFYGDDEDARDNPIPGARNPLRYQADSSISQPGGTRCVTLAGAVRGKSLRRGAHWLGIAVETGVNMRLGQDRYTNDDPLPTDDDEIKTEVASRELQTEGGEWDDWESGSAARREIKAYGIRMVVDHGTTTTPEPDPEPDPDPEDNMPPGPLTFPPSGPGYTNCQPTVSRLVFDGDYRVSLCYETADGTIGQARAGIYKSGESGLLWFFDPDNAETLIKVLDGCDQNGHRWVFMAAATDVAFNLYVTDGMSQTWNYHNKLGEAAATQTDTMALRCSQ